MKRSLVTRKPSALIMRTAVFAKNLANRVATELESCTSLKSFTISTFPDCFKFICIAQRPLRLPPIVFDYSSKLIVPLIVSGAICYYGNFRDAIFHAQLPYLKNCSSAHDDEYLIQFEIILQFLSRKL